MSLPSSMADFVPCDRLLQEAYSTKLNATDCLITQDPSLMFSIVKVARDQRVPGSPPVSPPFWER